MLSHPQPVNLVKANAPRRSLGTHVPRLATEFCKLRVVGSIPTVSNFPQDLRPALNGVSMQDCVRDSCRTPQCGVAELVQRPAVNGRITGSNPVTTAMDMKRIGKRPVLKTGALTGCGFESLPCPPFFFDRAQSARSHKPCFRSSLSRFSHIISGINIMLFNFNYFREKRFVSYFWRSRLTVGQQAFTL
jgi:hypothetical protein